jgi:spore coat polysaccharide biosynthesis protein SpsF
MIEHAMAALSLITEADHYLLTDAESAAVLAPVAESWDFGVLEGPKDDVLRRYAMMAEARGAEVLVRATGDNPLVSPKMVGKAIKLLDTAEADLAAFDNLPLGTGVEVIRASALLRANKEATARDEREHVTLHLYRNPDRYRIDRRPAPGYASMPEGRVTLDTEEDYLRLSELFDRIYRGRPPEIEEVIAELRAPAKSKEEAPCRR